MNRKDSSSNKKKLNRDSIIGLGEDSFRKSYYPELQDKINALEKTNSRNKVIISTIPDLLLFVDVQGNMSPCQNTTSEDKELMDTLLSQENILLQLKTSALKLEAKNETLIEEFSTTVDGSVYYFEARFSRSETNEILIIIRNITNIKLAFMQLRDLAERDPLTNLYNRRIFEETLRKYDKTNVELFTIISIDVNGLKFINDTLGHQVGDTVLIESSHLFASVFEEYGSLFRTGGDEFVVIMQGIEEPQIEKLIKKLTDQVDDFNYSLQPASLSFACGYAFHRTGPVNMSYLFQTADDNMYQNKLLKKESTRGTFVKAFLKALEAKDYISEGHADRMEDLAVLISKNLKLHAGQIDRIILLTKFHDIGKIGIPDSILKKPGKLTPDEWVIMKSHSSIGERIAIESTEIKDIAPLILHHHERYDGMGYPSKMVGEDIPIECRILAIVDSFDAMTNDRPYHKACTISDAVTEIQKCSGGQFDPFIVQAFLRVYKELISS